MTTLKTVLRSAGLVLALFWLCSCGKSAEADKTVFSYDLTEETTIRSCYTQRTFGLKDHYCAALNDEALNASCATESRRALFIAAGCTGSFSAPISQPTSGGTGTGTSSTTPPSATPPPAPTVKPNPWIAYEFIQFTNGVKCTTGLQTFSKQSEICLSVLDDAANNNCARQQRQDYFDENCR